MYAAYLFSMVLGGSFMLLAIFGDIFGSDASDLDFDADVDADFQLEADVDADVDVDAHGHADTAAAKIFSFRTIVYALFGFGAVGWLLTQLGFVPAAPVTIAYAAGGGLVSGTLVQRVFTWLKRTDTGLHEADDSFIGLPGDVVLPLGGGSPGSVAIERGDRRHRLRALPHPGAPDDVPLEAWKNVVVVEMKDGVAYVVPSDEDLKALP